MELPICRSTDDRDYSSSMAFPELEDDGPVHLDTDRERAGSDEYSEFVEGGHAVAEELGTDESIEDIMDTVDLYLNKGEPVENVQYMQGLEKMLESSPKKAMNTIKRALMEKDSILKQQSSEVKALHAEIQRKTEDARLAAEIGQKLLAEKEKLTRHNMQLREQLQSASSSLPTSTSAHGGQQPERSNSNDSQASQTKSGFEIFQDNAKTTQITTTQQSKPNWAISPITAFRSPFTLLGFGSQGSNKEKDFGLSHQGSSSKELGLNNQGSSKDLRLSQGSSSKEKNMAFSPSLSSGPYPSAPTSNNTGRKNSKENLSPAIIGNNENGKTTSEHNQAAAVPVWADMVDFLRQELADEFTGSTVIDISRLRAKLEEERREKKELQSELWEVKAEREQLRANNTLCQAKLNALPEAKLNALPEVEQAVTAAQEAEEESQVLRVQMARLESALQAQMELNDQMKQAKSRRHGSSRRADRSMTANRSMTTSSGPHVSPAPSEKLNKSTVRFERSPNGRPGSRKGSSKTVQSLLKKKKKQKSKGKGAGALNSTLQACSDEERELATEEEEEEHDQGIGGERQRADSQSSLSVPPISTSSSQRLPQKLLRALDGPSQDSPETQTRFRGSSEPTNASSSSPASDLNTTHSPSSHNSRMENSRVGGLLDQTAPLVHQLVTPRPRPSLHKRVSAERYATLQNTNRSLPKTLLSAQQHSKLRGDNPRFRSSSGLVGDWGVLMNALHMPYCKWRELPLFRELIWQGIPKGIRPMVWLSMAQDGSEQPSSLISRNKYYSDLLRRSECDIQAEVQQDISKDVHRTLPTQSYFQRSAGKAALRRVLTAFAVHNPDIGYCQGLNFLAGALLLIMKNEADTFWLLRHVVDPRTAYYTNSLCGLHVDLRVLEDLVTFYEPDIAKVLVKKNIQLRNLCASWIMCIFMESPLPFACCARFWDVFLFYGDELVFYMVLAILQTQRSKILAAKTPEEVMEVFLHNIKNKFKQKPQESMDALMAEVKRVYMDQSQESADTVIGLRQFHQSNVLTEHSVLNASMIQRLAKNTDFDELELHKMWHMFLQDSWHILVTGAIDNVVDFLKALTTCAFDEQQLQSWRGRGLISGVFHRWFQVMDENGDGKVSFEEFINGVALFRKAGRNERLGAAFRFCDLNQQNCIGKEELARTLTMFEHLYNGHRKKCAETQVFCDMIFEKFAKGQEHIQWETFVRCALLHPLIVRFFRLQ
eukprot:g3897.t1